MSFFMGCPLKGARVVARGADVNRSQREILRRDPSAPQTVGEPRMFPTSASLELDQQLVVGGAVANHAEQLLERGRGVLAGELGAQRAEHRQLLRRQQLVLAAGARGSDVDGRLEA